MKIAISTRLAAAAIVAACVVATVGCQKKYVPPPIDPTAITGDWVQYVETAPENPRVRAAAPPKYLRHLTINADKSFTFSIVNKDGSPANPNWNAEGTWEVRKEEGGGEMLYFTVTKNNIPDSSEYHGWVPASSIGIRPHEIGSRGRIDAMDVADAAGAGAVYIRP